MTSVVPARSTASFSAAICSSVSPSHSTWSSPTEVRAVAVESITFVASRRPPSPASTTATSTPSCSNATKETAIAASNWVTRSGLPSSSTGSSRSTAAIAVATRSTAAASDFGAISEPPIVVRSLHRQTCGEMQVPLSRPLPSSIAAVVVATDVLPLVPTTCSVR